MKLFLIFIIVLYFTPCSSQNIITKDGEFMDTSSNINPKCAPSVATYTSGYIGSFYYYSYGCKYPRSSATLLKDAKTFLAKKNNPYSGNGYITFRFTIDCEGKMLKKVQVLQTDDSYTHFRFDKRLVNELFDYLNTLTQWKIAGAKRG